MICTENCGMFGCWNIYSLTINKNTVLLLVKCIGCTDVQNIYFGATRSPINNTWPYIPVSTQIFGCCEDWVWSQSQIWCWSSCRCRKHRTPMTRVVTSFNMPKSRKNAVRRATLEVSLTQVFKASTQILQSGKLGKLLVWGRPWSIGGCRVPWILKWKAFTWVFCRRKSLLVWSMSNTMSFQNKFEATLGGQDDSLHWNANMTNIFSSRPCPVQPAVAKRGAKENRPGFSLLVLEILMLALKRLSSTIWQLSQERMNHICNIHNVEKRWNPHVQRLLNPVALSQQHGACHQLMWRTFNIQPPPSRTSVLVETACSRFAPSGFASAPYMTYDNISPTN